MVLFDQIEALFKLCLTDHKYYTHNSILKSIVYTLSDLTLTHTALFASTIAF